MKIKYICSIYIFFNLFLFEIWLGVLPCRNVFREQEVTKFRDPLVQVQKRWIAIIETHALRFSTAK